MAYYILLTLCSSFLVLVGILVGEAKCRKESLLGWSSIGNTLFPGEELLGGKIGGLFSRCLAV